KEGWMRPQAKDPIPLKGADGVVESWITQPPRPLHQRKLRSIFLVSRPPLLEKEGNPPQFKTESLPESLIHCNIQHRYIYAGFAKESQIRCFGKLRDQLLDLIHR